MFRNMRVTTRTTGKMGSAERKSADFLGGGSK